MSDVESIIVRATLAFFSTTMDDFAVMLVFFSRAQLEFSSDVRTAYLKVIAGQTLGFTIVVVISLLGMILGIFVPENYIDLIGLFPLAMGLWKAYELLDDDGCLQKCYRSSDDEGREANPDENFNGYQNELHLSPLVRRSLSESRRCSLKSSKSGDQSSSKSTGTKDEVAAATEDSSSHPLGIEREVTTANYGSVREERESQRSAEHIPTEDQHNVIADTVQTLLVPLLDPFMLEVCVVALLVSSDNIAIYMSLFASLRPWYVFLTCIVFYMLLAFNIVVAVLLMKCQPLAACFEYNSKYLVPILLVGLGVYILSDSIIWPF